MKFNEHIDLLLKEYVNSDMSALARYVGSSKEERIEFLPSKYAYLLSHFLDDVEVSKSELGVSDEDAEDDEIVDELEQNKSDYYKQFGEWLYDKVLADGDELIPETDLPSWVYFDDPKLVKNQWLVHFTKNDSSSIAEDGFIYGVDDIEKLGLTTWIDEDDKRSGGYNFAYLVTDKFKMERGKYVYGNEAVLFRASGYRFYHNSDEEYQTIFRGDTATCIIPIIAGEEDRWSVRNILNGDSLFENNKIDAVIKWTINNYDQYRKVLHR